MFKLFRHYVPTSLVLLVLIELVVFYISFLLGIEIRFYRTDEIIRQELNPVEIKAIVFALIMWLSMTAVGLHTRNVVDDFAGLMIRIFLSFTLGFVGVALAFYVKPELFIGRGAFALALLISFFGILITRTFYQKLDNHKIFRRKILVLGTGDQASLIDQISNQCMSRGMEIIGFVHIDQNDPKISANKLLDIQTTLYDLVEEYHIDDIVLAMDDRRKGFPVAGLIECKMNGINILDIVKFLEIVTGHIELHVLHPSVLIFTEGAIRPGFGKRIFDVVVSLAVLTIASPIILLTGLAIWLSSFGRDPVFYRQVRVGICDKPFKVLKFRSMKVDAEKDGAQMAKKKDSRVTLIGKFIRKTRIDELPQLINVLRGDMSFVGPRPERPEFVLGYNQDIPNYTLRHTVKPGITGWAQVSYPYGDTLEDTRQKLQYDLYYIKNYSLFFDFTIMLQTIQVVLFGQGAR